MSATQVPMLWWILAVVVSIITLIYIISMCAARKQIKTAIALVKEGSMVIKDRPQTMFYPFNILVIQIGVLAYFILLVLFLQVRPRRPTPPWPSQAFSSLLKPACSPPSLIHPVPPPPPDGRHHH